MLLLCNSGVKRARAWFLLIFRKMAGNETNLLQFHYPDMLRTVHKVNLVAPNIKLPLENWDNVWCYVIQ